MSIGNIASLEMKIKEPTVFKSERGLESMSSHSFDKGKAALEREVPPIISNPE